jgi:hypothetical protein
MKYAHFDDEESLWLAGIALVGGTERKVTTRGLRV